MKNMLLVLAILAVTGCKPIPADATPTSGQALAKTSDDVEQLAQAKAKFEQLAKSNSKFESEPSRRISDNEVIISTSKNSDHYQSVKRVEDKDAVCWVVMNTKTWDSNISCIPKSQLTVSDEPEQKHSVTPSN